MLLFTSNRRYVSLCLATEIVIPFEHVQEAMSALDYRMPRFVEKFIKSILAREPLNRMVKQTNLCRMYEVLINCQLLSQSVPAQLEMVEQFLVDICLINSPSKKSSESVSWDSSVLVNTNSHNEHVADVKVEPLPVKDADELFNIPSCVIDLSSSIRLSFGCAASNNQRQDMLISTQKFDSVCAQEAVRLEYLIANAQLSTFIFDRKEDFLRNLADTSSSSNQWIEICVVDSASHANKPISDHQVKYLVTDRGDPYGDDRLRKEFFSIYEHCRELMRENNMNVLVTIGESSIIAATASNLNHNDTAVGNINLYSHEPDRYASCSRRAITSGIVLARALMHGISGSSGSSNFNAIADFDRILPGISQVCCLDTARELATLS